MAGYESAFNLQRIKQRLFDITEFNGTFIEHRQFKNLAAPKDDRSALSLLSIYKFTQKKHSQTSAIDQHITVDPTHEAPPPIVFYAKAVMNLSQDHPCYRQLDEQAREMLQCEVIAGKVHQLRHPGHPDVFPAIRTLNRLTEYLVVSEEVEGETLFYLSEENDKASIAELIGKNKFRGYGHVVVTSAELGESDLRRRNLVVRNGVVIKIDNGLCFPSVQPNPVDQILTSVNHVDHNLADSYPVYPDLYIANPPPGSQTAYVRNWGDAIQRYVRPRGYDHTASGSIRQNPVFQREMNATFVQMFCLPDIMLKTLCNTCVPSSSDRVSRSCHESLLAYQERVWPHVSTDLEFLSYLASVNAEKDLEDYIDHLEQFTADGSYRLVDVCGITNIRQEMRDQLLDLRLSILSDPQNPDVDLRKWYDRHVQQYDQKRTKHFRYGFAAGVVLSAIALAATTLATTLAMGLIVMFPILCIAPLAIGKINQHYNQAIKHPRERFWEFYCRHLNISDLDIPRRVNIIPSNSPEVGEGDQQHTGSDNSYGTATGRKIEPEGNGIIHTDDAAGVGAIARGGDGQRSSSNLTDQCQGSDAECAPVLEFNI